MEKTISICLTLPVLFVSTSFAATLCSSDSAPARIDLTTGTRTARLTETIRYSTTWETNGTEGVTTVVFVGSMVLSAVEDDGSGGEILCGMHDFAAVCLRWPEGSLLG